jgi:hypothetical protein
VEWPPIEWVGLRDGDRQRYKGSRVSGMDDGAEAKCLSQ